jgi:hypothetical protein
MNNHRGSGFVQLRESRPIAIQNKKGGVDPVWSCLACYFAGQRCRLVAGRKVAYLICYEQLLVFPVLISLAHSPDVLVGAANDWWARETSIPTIQGQALDAWGRLFGLPVVRATNI